MAAKQSSRWSSQCSSSLGSSARTTALIAGFLRAAIILPTMVGTPHRCATAHRGRQEFSSFSDAGFDVQAWINAALASHGDAPLDVGASASRLPNATAGK